METWTYGEAAGPARFPWPPHEEGSVLGAFGETWKGATFDPGAFFRRLPARESIGPALLYYLVLGILLAGVALFWDITGVFTAGDDRHAVAEQLGIGTLSPVVGFLVSPLALLLGLVIAAALTHVLLLVFGAARNGFNATLRVFCYAYSPMAFGVVPVLGHVIGTIWMVVVAIIGLREAHRTEGWKATVAVLLPFFLLIAFLVTATLFLMAAGMVLLSS